MRAAAQYNVSDRLMGCGTFDITQHPWRCGGIFDAIVTGMYRSSEPAYLH